jgi:hypothetical protein
LIEAPCQALEDARVVISRAAGTTRPFVRFQLVAGRYLHLEIPSMPSSPTPPQANPFAIIRAARRLL